VKVIIELAVVTKKQRVRIGSIDMEVKLTNAVDLVLDQAVKLTERETRVRDLMLKGLIHKEISAELKISERMVKYYAHCIYKKYGVRDRTMLMYGLATHVKK
jgi:DNA-binding NarL/FixJ family response regulator